jgi:hypothetical protein
MENPLTNTRAANDAISARSRARRHARAARAETVGIITSGARKEQMMSREEALKAWRQMYSEIDKDNWLFVGTINPQMVEWAIKALEGADDETD